MKRYIKAFMPGFRPATGPDASFDLSSQRICYPLLMSREFQIPISVTSDFKSEVA